MENEELKECPFCGHIPFIKCFKYHRENRYLIKCDHCLFRFKSSNNYFSIVNSWNTRKGVENGK